MHDVYLGNFQQMCAYMTWAEDNFLWTHIPSYDWAWVLEDNFVVSSPSFHHVGPRDQAQVIKLGSKYLYLLIYLNAHPHHTHICFFFFFETVSHWLRTCQAGSAFYLYHCSWSGIISVYQQEWDFLLLFNMSFVNHTQVLMLQDQHFSNGTISPAPSKS